MGDGLLLASSYCSDAVRSWMRELYLGIVVEGLDERELLHVGGSCIHRVRGRKKY